MKDYSDMSRAEIVARLAALEAGRTQPAIDTALADSEKRLRAILETAVEAIITIDERGLIESLNPAAERTFGYSSAEVVGKNVSLLMPSPQREAHDGYMASYLRTGVAKIIGIGREVIACRKDGSVFPIELAVSEVRLARRRLFTGFIRDIAERKRLEREILEISDREQRRIGQDLHDGLCQQLAGIELMSQALERKLRARHRAAAARVAEIAGHVRDAIAQTRLLARGLSPVTLESEGLMSALKELSSNTEKMFRVACRFECPAPVLVEDAGMATNLFRIAQEAASNAIKHGKAKRLTIRLSEEGGRLSLAITDNGRGFGNVASDSNGMGLRIMQSRAGMMGGTLTTGNAPGGGARVMCTVTRTPA